MNESVGIVFWKYLQCQIVSHYVFFKIMLIWLLIVLINDENNILATSQMIKKHNVKSHWITVHDDATRLTCGQHLGVMGNE